MVKALVTGGTGFVGSHIVRVLREAGHEVRVLHRETSRLDALAGLDFESWTGGLLDEGALRSACSGCEWVFHVAAVADYWQADVAQMYHINVEGTRRVLRAARESGVKRVIFTSSAAAIGLRRDGFPADESLDYAGSPQQFPYAYSKVMAERVARHAVHEYEQDIVTVNPVIVLGPGDLNMISGRFITETRRLQWTIPVTKGRIGVVDVRDVAHWHLAAAEQGKSGYRYILGTANYHLYDWYRLCAEVVGVAAPFIHVPALFLPVIARLIDLLHKMEIHLPVDASQVRLSVKRMHYNYSAAHEAFGPPQISMRQSLEDTYRWYAEHSYLKPDALADWIARLGRLLGRRA